MMKPLLVLLLMFTFINVAPADYSRDALTAEAIEVLENQAKMADPAYLLSDEYKLSLINFNPTNSVQTEGHLAITNLNPGNLRAVRSGHFRSFQTLEAGYNALINDIEIKKSGRSRVINKDATLYEFIHIYAPSCDGNDPDQYAYHVANGLGVPINILFKDINSHDLAKFIIQKESHVLFEMMYS